MINSRKFSEVDLRKSFSTVKWHYHGKVIRIVGTLIEASVKNCQIGSIVRITTSESHQDVIGEVVGFKTESTLILPYTHLTGVAPGSIVSTVKYHSKIPVGDFLLGQVIDAFCHSLSGISLSIPDGCQHFDLDKLAPNPLMRSRIAKPLSLGVRAMDGVLTFGQGQRIGIMAGSGVGKSVLMGMIARNCEADINVIALIGERGREVREFIEKDLGSEGLKRSVVVAVTSDQSPLMRIRGAKIATTIAEYFSHKGCNVLLMLDSLTRIAMAQREVGNAIGEPPTTKGYTPSVFSLLPQLLERAGPQPEGRGSISGLYTVLVDGDDFSDPIADAARSLLDGHINLSRNLANKGHFPAIDISTSTSRVMHDIVHSQHWDLAQKLKAIIGNYLENYDLVQIGAYQPGTNPMLDEAISLMPLINRFLQQKINEMSSLEEAISGLSRILQGQPFRDTDESQTA